MDNDNAIDLGLSWVERIGNERGIISIRCDTAMVKLGASTPVDPLNNITSITFVFGPSDPA